MCRCLFNFLLCLFLVFCFCGFVFLCNFFPFTWSLIDVLLVFHWCFISVVDAVGLVGVVGILDLVAVVGAVRVAGLNRLRILPGCVPVGRFAFTVVFVVLGESFTMQNLNQRFHGMAGADGKFKFGHIL